MSPVEWCFYLAIKKDEMGDRRFALFMQFLHREIPRCVARIEATTDL